MSKKDVLHIPTPETPPPGRTAQTEEEEHAPHVPSIRPFEGPAHTPGHTDNPRIITPQPSSNPYPGVHVS
jgi:hypothetical protein